MHDATNTSSARQLTRVHGRENQVTMRPNGSLCDKVLAEDRANAWAGAERLTQHPEACFGKRPKARRSGLEARAVARLGRL